MLRTITGIQKIAIAMGTTCVLGGALPLAVGAQTTHKHHSIFRRHPNATGAVAGYAAYKTAKNTGHNRTASGRHRNFAQRHPVLTGAAAAAAAHHYAKKQR